MYTKINPFEHDKEAMKLREEFQKHFKCSPPGINYDEFNSMEEYKDYLRKQLEEK